MQSGASSYSSAGAIEKAGCIISADSGGIGDAQQVGRLHNLSGFL